MPSIANSTRTFMKAQVEPKKPKKPRKKLKLTIQKPKVGFAWWLVLAFALLSVFLFVQYREAQAKLHTPSTAANTKQVNDVVAKVRRLVVVPSDQTPTVATVAHAEKLRSQTFFANARDGDKVVVFSKQKQAILYRPSTNQIVTISAVQVTPAAATPAAPAP